MPRGRRGVSVPPPARAPLGGGASLWTESLSEVLAAQLGDVPQAAAIVETIAASLAPTTAEQYGHNFARFVQFCNRQLDRPSPLPATTGTVLRWLAGDVCARGSVKAGSLQPYLSAINTVHTDLGFDAPALGHLISRFKRGLAHRQTAAGREAERVYLPAPVVEEVHEWALALDLSRATPAQVSAFRAAVATTLNFCFFARGATGSALLDGHVRRSDEALHITLEHEKGKAKNARSRVITMPSGSVLGLEALLAKWELYRGQVDPRHSYFALPSELAATKGRRHVTFPSTRIDQWVHEILGHLGRRPPAGDKWTGHSERKGAASASSAIGVQLDRICWCGGWSIRSAVVHDYIDPTCPPSRAAFRYFGWLRPPASM